MPTASQARTPRNGGPTLGVSPESYIRSLYNVEPVRDPRLARQLGRPATAVDTERKPAAEDGRHYGVGPAMLTPRKLRGPQREAPSDAAGQLTNMKWRGRDVPRRGQGMPPPDNREEVHIKVKAMHPRHSHLLCASERDVFGSYGYAGMGEEGLAKNTGRKSVAQERASDEYGNHMFGGVLKPMSESGERVVPKARRTKGLGAPPVAMRVNTSNRVYGTEAGLTEDDINPGAINSHRTPQGAKRRPVTASAAYRDSVGGMLTQEWAQSTRGRQVPQSGWRQVERAAQEARLADSKAVWSDAHASGAANRLRGMHQTFTFG